MQKDILIYEQGIAMSYSAGACLHAFALFTYAFGTPSTSAI